MQVDAWLPRFLTSDGKKKEKKKTLKRPAPREGTPRCIRRPCRVPLHEGAKTAEARAPQFRLQFLRETMVVEAVLLALHTLRSSQLARVRRTVRTEDPRG